jgi:hypothetical protein
MLCLQARLAERGRSACRRTKPNGRFGVGVGIAEHCDIPDRSSNRYLRNPPPLLKSIF